MNRRPAALTAGWLLTFPSRGGWVGRGGLLCDHPSRLAPRGGGTNAASLPMDYRNPAEFHVSSLLSRR
jgi:hypothetical protein